MATSTEEVSQDSVTVCSPEVAIELPESVKVGMNKAIAALAGAPTYTHTTLPQFVVTFLKDKDYTVGFFSPEEPRRNLELDYEEIEGLALTLCRMGYKALEPLDETDAEDFLVYVSPTFIKELLDAGTSLLPAAVN